MELPFDGMPSESQMQSMDKFGAKFLEQNPVFIAGVAPLAMVGARLSLENPDLSIEDIVDSPKFIGALRQYVSFLALAGFLNI